MTTRKLDSSQWQTYFDDVAKRLPAIRVSVSVLGHDIGVQPETEDSRLIGISYDPHDEAFEVATPNISHRVMSPVEISVQEKGGLPVSIEVVEKDGTRQIIELSRLPSLPPA